MPIRTNGGLQNAEASGIPTLTFPCWQRYLMKRSGLPTSSFPNVGIFSADSAFSFWTFSNGKSMLRVQAGGSQSDLELDTPTPVPSGYFSDYDPVLLVWTSANNGTIYGNGWNATVTNSIVGFNPANTVNLGCWYGSSEGMTASYAEFFVGTGIPNTTQRSALLTRNQKVEEIADLVVTWGSALNPTAAANTSAGTTIPALVGSVNLVNNGMFVSSDTHPVSRSSGLSTDFAFISSVATTPSINGPQFTAAMDTTAAKVIVAVATAGDYATMSISDNHGLSEFVNTWPAPQVFSAAGVEVTVWVLRNPLVNISHSFVLRGSPSDFYGSMVVAAFSGELAASAFIESVTTGGGAGLTSQSIGPVTPSQSKSLVIAAFGSGAVGSLSIGSGFTNMRPYNGQDGVAVGRGFAYLIQTSAAPVTSNWSWSSSQPAAAQLLVLKNVNGTSGGPSSPTVTLQPSNVTVVSPNAAMFIAAANDDDAGGWQVDTLGDSNWSDISGSTRDSLTTGSTSVTSGIYRNGTRVRAWYSLAGGSRVYSDAATLTVNSPNATTIVIDLKLEDGISPAADLTGIEYAILNSNTLATSTSVIDNGSGESTNSTGRLSIDISGLGLDVGDVVYVIVGNSSGVVSEEFEGWHGPAITS